MVRSAGKQREHRPHALGPRIFFRGRYAQADLRPWGGDRPTLRDPAHPDWPSSGEPTEDEDTARQWGWAYVAYYRDAERRRVGGQLPPPRRLGKAIEDYLKHRATSFTKNTCSSDRTCLKHLSTFCGNNTPTDQILAVPSKNRAAGYFYLQDLVDERLRAGYAHSTMRTVVTGLAPFFDWLGSGINVWDVVLPKRAETEVRDWTDDELGAIREAADYVDRTRKEPDWPSARTTVEWFLASGCREQEGFAAETRRINGEQCTVRLVYQLDKDNRDLVPLKGKRARIVLLLPSWWEHHARAGTPFVLAKSDGRPLGYRAQRNLITRVLDVARLNELGCGYHRFRHTYARLFLERGRMEHLQKSLGHTSIITTERSYGHYQEDVAAEHARVRIYQEVPIRAAR